MHSRSRCQSNMATSSEQCRSTDGEAGHRQFDVLTRVASERLPSCLSTHKADVLTSGVSREYWDGAHYLDVEIFI